MSGVGGDVGMEAEEQKGAEEPEKDPHGDRGAPHSTAQQTLTPQDWPEEEEIPVPQHAEIGSHSAAPQGGVPEPPAGHGQEEPPAGHGQEEPPAGHGQEDPPAGHGQEEPPAGHGQEEPPAEHGQVEPPAEHGQEEPPAGHGQEEPPVGHGQEEPPAEHGQEEPPAGHGQEEPPAGHGQEEAPVGHGQEEPLAGHRQEEPPAGHGQEEPPAGHGPLEPPAAYGQGEPPAGHGPLEPPAAYGQGEPPAGHGEPAERESHREHTDCDVSEGSQTPELEERTQTVQESSACMSQGVPAPPGVAEAGGSEPGTAGRLDEGCEEGISRDLPDSASAENTLEDSGDFPSLPSVIAVVTPVLAPPAAPIQRDEDITAESWRTRRKHVFVLSEAGKPIYSRYGNEEALSSTMGVMMALVSFVQSGNNFIRSIHSDNQKVVFLQEGPLVLVAVSRTLQSEEQLRRELQYVNSQIISMLTQASVARIFERKKNYDLRRLLAGSEKILDSLLDLLETDPGVLLGAVRCLPLSSPLRDSLSSILTKAITPNLVFSILVAERQLVTVVQERAVIEDCRLDPADLHLLLNLIGASSAFQAGEIWTPICLPRFNPDGYFYAYISYLDPLCTVCLVLLSTDKESFYAVSGCKQKIQEAMEAQNSLQALAGALQCCSYSASLVGVPELLHFVYKPLDIPDSYRQLPQFTSPEAEGPYLSEEERQRLFDLYRYLHSRIHSSARPLRLIYHVAEKETLLAWVTSKFELYTAFSSMVTKVGAINVITKLLRWIKKEEDRLFIRYPPKYSTTPLPGKPGKATRPDRTDPSQNGFFSGL